MPKQAHVRPRVDEEIDVALGTEVAARHRAEYAHIAGAASLNGFQNFCPLLLQDFSRFILDPRILTSASSPQERAMGRPTAETSSLGSC